MKTIRTVGMMVAILNKYILNYYAQVKCIFQDATVVRKYNKMAHIILINFVVDLCMRIVFVESKSLSILECFENLSSWAVY
jgi:hypothetical protein